MFLNGNFVNFIVDTVFRSVFIIFVKEFLYWGNDKVF